jgi:hypothetical protein
VRIFDFEKWVATHLARLQRHASGEAEVPAIAFARSV